MTARILSILLLSPLLFLGCGDESSGGEMMADGPPALDEVRQVFAMSCSFSSCHSTDRGAGGLTLQVEPLKALVGVPSTGATDRILVVPGQPDDSYLMEKLTVEMPALGDRMPPSTSLDSARLDLIVRWIQTGAPTE